MTTREPTAGRFSSLESRVVGRTQSLFAADMASRDAELKAGIAGQAVLVVGGAGSIGAATAKLVAGYGPAALHVVDQDENGLAELVRDLRSSGLADRVREFRTLALDYGSPSMQRFLSASPAYGLVLNFAAIKHVRSEKDVPSLLHLLDTNVVKPRRLLNWLGVRGFSGAYYAVSTDKAADPVNFMGASKRLQELLTLAGPLGSAGARLTCARFANVAFSNGSLLHGFLQRLERGQALAVPRHIDRYFISHNEAADICVLAGVCGPSRHTMIPRVGGTLRPVPLVEVARMVLETRGLKPRSCATEEEARAQATHPAPGTYPVLLTEPDTSGEKPSEEFVGAGERALEIGFQNLLGIPQDKGPGERAAACAAELEHLIAAPDRPVATDDLRALVASVLPNFHHAASGKHLDQRM